MSATNLLKKVKLIDIHVELFKRGNYSLFTDSNNLRHEKQYEALELLASKQVKELFYGGAAGGAKSFTGCYWLTMLSLIYPNTSWFVCRQNLVDLRNSVTNTFYKVWDQIGLPERPKYNGTDHFWRFKNNSSIYYLAAKWEPNDPFYQRFGSREFTGGWFEEAGEVSGTAYELINSRAGRQMNKEYNLSPKIFSTFNPSKGYIYQYAYKPFKEGTLKPNQYFLKALVTDNPHISQDYIENLKGLNNKIQKERLLYGNFDYDDDPNKLYEYDKILNIFTNSFVEGGEKYITCDVAFQGSDRMVIMVWEGMRIVEIYVEEKSKAKDIEEKIRELALKHKVPQNQISFDNDGVGGFLSSYLEDAIPFVNNSKALNGENYQNLKTQCFFKLADYINSNNIYCLDSKHKELIIEELDIIAQKDPDSDGKLKIISKETMKEKLGRSPDFADCIMQRMIFEYTVSYSFPEMPDFSKINLKI